MCVQLFKSYNYYIIIDYQKYKIYTFIVSKIVLL